MAGLVKDFSPEERGQFFDIAEKFAGISALEALDILANLAAAAVSSVSKGLDQADNIADEFSANLKLLIRKQYPDMPVVSPSGFKRVGLQ
jgi:hypothetical protein